MPGQFLHRFFCDSPGQLFRKLVGAALFLGSLTLVLLAAAPPASAAATWTVQSVFPANDGTGRVLWVKPGTTDANGVYSGDTASVWSLNSQGSKTAIGPNYGPYPGWTAQDIETAPDGTTRLEWIKSGTYNDTYTHYTGDTVSIWTLNSSGVKITAGPAYGPFADWQNYFFDVAHDSTVHLYWQKSGYSNTNIGDTISVWRLNAAGTEIAEGPAYGPFAGWHAFGAQPASDDTLRVQWVKAGTTGSNGVTSGDQVSVWTLNTNGTETSIGPTYGPYTGWTTSYLSLAPDKTVRLSWVKRGYDPNTGVDTGDAASVWTLDATGKETSIGPAYGPYPGWQCYGAQAAPDNSARLYWVTPGTTDNDGSNNTGDKVSLWALDSKGSATSQGPAYGPFAGWTTNYYVIAPDGTSRLGWIKRGTTDVNNNYSGDTASIWTLSAAGTQTAMGPAYGPYPNWSAEFFYPATSSLTYLVWQHGTQYGFGGDEFSIWSLNTADSATLIGPTYGPF